MPPSRVSDEASFWSSGRRNRLRMVMSAPMTCHQTAVDEGAVTGPEDRAGAKERFGFGPSPMA